jgi:enamidase
MATGNTAKAYGLNAGIIAPGKEADFVIMDAPMGSLADDALGAIACGDLPGISYVIIDGQVKVAPSRNTPPAKRKGDEYLLC